MAWRCSTGKESSRNSEHRGQGCWFWNRWSSSGERALERSGLEVSDRIYSSFSWHPFFPLWASIIPHYLICLLLYSLLWISFDVFFSLVQPLNIKTASREPLLCSDCIASNVTSSSQAVLNNIYIPMISKSLSPALTSSPKYTFYVLFLWYLFIFSIGNSDGCY